MFNLESSLNEIKNSGLEREHLIHNECDFSSNDYLGLANSQEMKKELIQFIESGNDLFSPSSRLIRGTKESHIEAEQYLANYLTSESTLLYTSGHAANCGVIATFCKNSQVFSDQFNHASLIDGIRLSKSPCTIYPHNDLQALEALLQKSNCETPKYIITEALFSMDGTQPDIAQLIGLCERYNAYLILDEAHSTGLYGVEGRGKLSEHSFGPNRVISIHTCGKALGVSGAFVRCTHKQKKFLINHCRHHIYTTALPPLNTHAIRTAVELTRKSDSLREKLFSNIELLRSYFPERNLPRSPIIPYFLSGNHNILDLSRYLKENDIHVQAIRYPTVPEGQERLRISVHANHTQNQIINLAKLLIEREKEDLHV